MLNGYKTYTVVAIAVLLGGAEYIGWLPSGTFDKVDGLLALLGLGTLRNALAKK